MIDEKLNFDINSVLTSNTLKKIKKMIDDTTSEHMKSKTGKVWLQYMNMVSLTRQFIKSERTGNWELHLQSIKEMLAYLAAAGHNHYLKSARLYLQNMMSLKETHPDVYHMFMSGLHVIRRSDRYWAGLSADLVIEQEFMRALKSSGIIFLTFPTSIIDSTL
jgi:hypothetical protein